MISGAARLVRQLYCQRILKQIDIYKKMPESELEKITSKYESKNFFRKFFDFYSNANADYKAAKAIKNMRKLGLVDFKLEKNTVFGLYDELSRLEKSACAISQTSL